MSVPYKAHPAVVGRQHASYFKCYGGQGVTWALFQTPRPEHEAAAPPVHHSPPAPLLFLLLHLLRRRAVLSHPPPL